MRNKLAKTMETYSIDTITTILDHVLEINRNFKVRITGHIQTVGFPILPVTKTVPQAADIMSQSLRIVAILRQMW